MKEAVIITGATGLLGSSLALKFWDKGFDLLITSKNKKKLELIKKNLPKKDQTCELFAADLSCENSLSALTNKIKGSELNFSVLINNAATHGPIGKTWEIDLKEWRQSLEVNLLAPLELCRTIIPMMIKRESGTIINISGGGASASRANFSSYACSKTSLVRLTETLAKETEGTGITVNSIAPGMMNSSLLKELIALDPKITGEEEFSKAKDVVENPSNENLEQTIDLILFLISGEGRVISGKFISSIWDNWSEWTLNFKRIMDSDLYTLRRVTTTDKT